MLDLFFCGEGVCCLFSLLLILGKSNLTWSLGSYVNVLMFSDIAQSSIPCVTVCPLTPFVQPGMCRVPGELIHLEMMGKMWQNKVDFTRTFLNQNFSQSACTLSMSIEIQRRNTIQF